MGLGAKAPAPKRVSEGYVKDERFMASQRAALERERATYLEQAESLRAEAESLVEEMEPGDIQFDEESGEGGTVTVDRERDLALSAQALAAVEEIDHALAKMQNGPLRHLRGLWRAHPEGPPRGPSLRPLVHRLQERGALATLSTAGDDRPGAIGGVSSEDAAANRSRQGRSGSAESGSWRRSP